MWQKLSISLRDYHLTYHFATQKETDIQTECPNVL